MADLETQKKLVLPYLQVRRVREDALHLLHQQDRTGRRRQDAFRLAAAAPRARAHAQSSAALPR